MIIHHEELTPAPVARGRRGKHHLPLTPEEFSSFRPMLYKVNWLARESRPEASGIVSILAWHLAHATLRDIWHPNRLIRKIRDAASHPTITWPYEPEAMSFISMSDGGGWGGGGEARLEDHGQTQYATQGAWIVVASDEPLRAGRAAGVSFELEVHKVEAGGPVHARRRGPELERHGRRGGKVAVYVGRAAELGERFRRPAEGGDRLAPGPPHRPGVGHHRRGSLTKEDCTKVNSALVHLIRTGTFGAAIQSDDSRKSRMQKASERELARGLD